MLPATDAAPIDIDDPVQMLVLDIVAATGNAKTFIVTEFDFTHPLELVSVSV